jgi:putative glutamine amidotransferase
VAALVARGNGEAVNDNAHLWGRYPPVWGTPAFRGTVAAWLRKRYGLPDGMIDPETCVIPVSGTREALFMIALTVVPEAVRGGSFTVVYGAYLGHLTRAGAAAAVLAPGVPVPDVVRDHMDGLLLTGGGDVAPARFGSQEDARDVDPDRDELEIELVRHCRDRRVPVLGMCRGNQVLNVALGGTLRTVSDHVQREPLHTPVQAVTVDPGCGLAMALGEDTLQVNSFHRWAVDRPADGMAVSARTDDGVIEGIEWAGDDWFAVGAQWHAELLDAAHVPALFAAFVGAARERGGR